jgi:oligosaccharide repeat unit polymerase
MWLERPLALVVAAGCLTVALRRLRSAYRTDGAPVDVVGVFLAIWGAVLLLFAVPLIKYTTTPALAWLMTYGSIGAFVLGGLVANRGRHLRTDARVERAEPALRATIDARRLRRLWLVTLAIGLVGFIAFVRAVDLAAGWQTLIHDPETVRELKRDSAVFQSSFGLWKLLLYFNQVAFLLWTVGLRLKVFSEGHWRHLRVLGAASIVPFFLTADRGLLVALLAWAVVLHLLWPSRVNWRRFAVYLAVAIAFAGALITAIGNRYGGSLQDHPEIAAQVTIPALDSIAVPYLYLTANIPTFGQLTEDAFAPRTYGQMTVRPIVKAAHAAGMPGTPPVGTGVFYAIPFESFSNYGWLGSFWLDWRFLGTLLLPAAFAFVAVRAQQRLRRRPSFAKLWLCSLLLYVIALSPFANALSTTFTWQYLLATPLISLALDSAAIPTLRLQVELMRPAKRMALAACSVIALAALVATGLAVRGHGTGPSHIAAKRELDQAVRQAHYVFEQAHRYPEPLALATRLQVSRPSVRFRPLGAYTDPVPGQGVVAVFSTPRDVFLRVRASDGRLFEVHRTEDFGGVTFGPGTRDG